MTPNIPFLHVLLTSLHQLGDRGESSIITTVGWWRDGAVAVGGD
jgi:hypothetical protein